MRVKLPWNDARSHCQIAGKDLKLDGELASVDNEETQSFLTSFGLSQYWFGGFRDFRGKWTWSDGSVWNYTNWQWTQPDNYGGLEDRMIVTNGFWYDQPDILKLPFICQTTTKSSKRGNWKIIKEGRKKGKIFLYVGAFLYIEIDRKGSVEHSTQRIYWNFSDNGFPKYSSFKINKEFLRYLYQNFQINSNIYIYCKVF